MYKYKVLYRAANNGLYSFRKAHECDETSPSYLRYRIKNYIRAKIGGLFVFNTLEHASYFRNRTDWHIYGAVEIWKVRVRGKIQTPKKSFNSFSSLNDLSKLKEIWGGKAPEEARLPEGTSCFKEVCLVERAR